MFLFIKNQAYTLSLYRDRHKIDELLAKRSILAANCTMVMMAS